MRKATRFPTPGAVPWSGEWTAGGVTDLSNLTAQADKTHHTYHRVNTSEEGRSSGETCKGRKKPLS